MKLPRYMDFKKTAARVAALWLQAKGPLWDEFMEEVYEGGSKQVRNTNRDTQDRYPLVAISTLLKTDRKLRKLVQGQFARWKPQREKQGPPGELVEDLGQLERGQKIEWGPPKQRARGVVERARPDRAIVKLPDGRVQHIRPTDIETWQPRVL